MSYRLGVIRTVLFRTKSSQVKTFISGFVVTIMNREGCDSIYRGGNLGNKTFCRRHSG